MNCQEIDAILDEHKSRSLPAARRAAVDQHLARCERCSDAWLVHEALVNEPAAAAPPDLLARAAARAAGARSLDEAAPRPWAASRRWAARQGAGLGLAAAAAVAAVAIGLVSLQHSGREGTAADAPSARAPSPDAASGRTLAAQPGAEAAGPDVPRGAEAAPAAAAQATSLDALLERVRVDPRFLAGRDYERLATPVPTGSAPGRIEVCEFFMFGCVHCYALEPELERWALTKPDHVDLVRVPAIFNATARLHAQAFYAAEALGIVDELRGPFYEEIHVAGNKLDTVAAIETFFAEAGIGSAAFRVAFDSAAVRARVERAEELNRLYRVNATPSLAVNGKYLTNAAMAGTADALFEVVDSLVASESAASCGDRDASRCPVR